MKISLILAALSLFILPSQGHSEASFLGNAQSTHIVVNNRVLVKVNSKAISVIDLMKKMDLLFYREFPQYTSIPEARFQFYQANWKHVLNELIDKELVMADAEENKLPVSAGDVRQEMERLFGPNIIGNLDKIGMTFEEAWKIIHGDIIIHRMLYIRVNAKAMRNVTPGDVYAYYQDYAKDNMQKDQWDYRVITIRDKATTSAEETANLLYKYIDEEKIAFNEFSNRSKEITYPSTSQVTISELFSHKDEELSPIYKDVLQKMSEESFSTPITQRSKDNSLVYRIFYLEKMNPGGAPLFKNLENQLKDKLLEKEIGEKSQSYLKKLREHFDIQETVPENFEPFELK